MTKMCTEKVLQSDESIEKWTTTTKKSSYIPKKVLPSQAEYFGTNFKKEKWFVILEVKSQWKMCCTYVIRIISARKQKFF